MHTVHMAYRNPYFDASRAHHTPQGFRNLDPHAGIGGNFLRWQRERRAAGVPKPPAEGYADFARRWTQRPDFSGVHGDAAQVWWLGHACLLLRVDGRTLITDPVLSRRASPLPFAGPARKVPAVVNVAGLPPIDAVLVSHNHYDHFDSATLAALARRNPDALFVAPLGLAAPLRALGAREVRELDWWDCARLDALELHCVPAQHWSARTLLDRNRTLWGGFVVRGPSGTAWFAGDTGYTPRLAEIAQRLGPIDLAALPIGAYAPRWFMRTQHIDPAEAVQLHRELGVRQSFGIHWGSFELADDALDEPPQLLHRALIEHGLSPEDFWLLRQGEHRGYGRSA